MAEIRRAINNPHFAYYNEILDKMSRGEKLGIIEINDLGGRYSGKTYNAIDYLSYVPLVVPENLRVQGFGVRNTVSDSIELWDDFIEHCIENYEDSFSKCKVNNTKKRLTVNGRQIRVIGLKTNRKGRVVKTGLKRLKGGAYVVIMIDEAYEVDKQDYQALLEASGDAESIIIIRTANPFSRADFFIDYCIKHLKHNEKSLREQGEQFRVVKEITELENRKIETTKIFHYTNWRVNKQHLTDTTIQMILNTWNIDPYRARAVDLGMPMITSGAIYARLLHKIQALTPDDYAKFNEYYIGVDFGEVDATSAQYIAFSNNLRYVAIMDEYYHSNITDGYKDSRQTAIEIVAKIKEFIQANIKARQSGIEMFVDNATPAYIVILKEEVRRQGLAQIVSVRGAEKPPIVDRVNATTLIMGQQRMFMNFDKVKKLLWELELSVWDTEKAKLARVDKNDHAINAMEYGMHRNLYRMIEDFDPIKLW